MAKPFTNLPFSASIALAANSTNCMVFAISTNRKANIHRIYVCECKYKTMSAVMRYCVSNLVLQWSILAQNEIILMWFNDTDESREIERGRGRARPKCCWCSLSTATHFDDGIHIPYDRFCDDCMCVGVLCGSQELITNYELKRIKNDKSIRKVINTYHKYLHIR